jgi:hypothetical protein
LNSPFPLTGPYISLPPDIKPPRQQSWNVSVQRQIGSDLALSATYLGSYSDRLWNVRSLNQAVYIPGACTLETPTGLRAFNPCSTQATTDFRRKLTMANYATGKYLGAVDEHTALGTQRYNGLLLTLQRRAANGVTVSANYTLSKCKGHPNQVLPNVNSGYVNPDDIDYDYGACDSDRRHLFNLTASAETPEFENMALRVLASHWRLSGIFRAYSGSPFSVTVTTDPARSGIGGQRASQVLDDPYGARTLTNYLNPAAFADPALGTLGSQTRNSLYGPGTRTIDLSLVRSFRFAGTHRIEARIESFNALNWFLWNNPVSNRNNVQFGRITSAADPRIMQFAVKYQF